MLRFSKNSVSSTAIFGCYIIHCKGGVKERCRVQNIWKRGNPDETANLPGQGSSESVLVTVTSRRMQSRFATSPLLIIYFFLAIIFLGTILLLLPFASKAEGSPPFPVALFTATSAITVTGLVVEDTAFYWTRVGQAIIMGMIYIGGLGFMTIATFLLIILGQRVTLTQRLLMRENLMLDQFGNLVRLTVAIVLVATGVQLIGFIVLFTYFYLFVYPMGEAIWQAAFHAVSAFNNAGFIAFNHPSGLAVFQTDKFIVGVMGALIFAGGISYLVVIDLVRVRRFSRFALNTKLVLVATAVLLLVGFTAIFVLEFNNPHTIGNLSLPDKVLVSVFHSISDRTAGFNIVDIGGQRDGTHILQMALMFIGGASASVAGGIKVNTMAVVFMALVAQIRHRNKASAFGREVPDRQVQRSYLIVSVAVAFVFLVVMLLSITEEGADSRAVIFEAISAFGTCGLSLGMTSALSPLGQLIITATMFVGKLGPLLIGVTMSQGSENDLYRYAQERVTIG